MIKINLLPEGSRRPAVERGGGPSSLKISPLLLLGLSAVLGFGAVGALGWYWNSRIARLEQQISKEQAEQARLAAIQKQNQVYENQVKELEQRLHTIQLLEAGRTGPVPLMSALGDTATQTRDLYLLSVSPEGDRLLLKGEAASAASIAGFITALKRSGGFADVELRQYYQDDEKERMVFKFDLNCAYGHPGSAASAARAGTGTGASGPRTKS